MANPLSPTYVGSKILPFVVKQETFSINFLKRNFTPVELLAILGLRNKNKISELSEEVRLQEAKIVHIQKYCLNFLLLGKALPHDSPYANIPDDELLTPRVSLERDLQYILTIFPNPLPFARFNNLHTIEPEGRERTVRVHLDELQERISNAVELLFAWFGEATPILRTRKIPQSEWVDAQIVLMRHEALPGVSYVECVQNWATRHLYNTTVSHLYTEWQRVAWLVTLILTNKNQVPDQSFITFQRPESWHLAPEITFRRYLFDECQKSISSRLCGFIKPLQPDFDCEDLFTDMNSQKYISYFVDTVVRKYTSHPDQIAKGTLFKQCFEGLKNLIFVDATLPVDHQRVYCLSFSLLCYVQAIHMLPAESRVFCTADSLRQLIEYMSTQRFTGWEYVREYQSEELTDDLHYISTKCPAEKKGLIALLRVIDGCLIVFDPERVSLRDRIIFCKTVEDKAALRMPENELFTFIVGAVTSQIVDEQVVFLHARQFIQFAKELFPNELDLSIIVQLFARDAKTVFLDVTLRTALYDALRYIKEAMTAIKESSETREVGAVFALLQEQIATAFVNQKITSFLLAILTFVSVQATHRGVLECPIDFIEFMILNGAYYDPEGICLGKVQQKEWIVQRTSTKQQGLAVLYLFAEAFGIKFRDKSFLTTDHINFIQQIESEANFLLDPDDVTIMLTYLPLTRAGLSWLGEYQEIKHELNKEINFPWISPLLVERYMQWQGVSVNIFSTKNLFLPEVVYEITDLSTRISVQMQCVTLPPIGVVFEFSRRFWALATQAPVDPKQRKQWTRAHLFNGALQECETKQAFCCQIQERSTAFHISILWMPSLSNLSCRRVELELTKELSNDELYAMPAILELICREDVLMEQIPEMRSEMRQFCEAFKVQVRHAFLQTCQPIIQFNEDSFTIACTDSVYSLVIAEYRDNVERCLSTICDYCVGRIAEAFYIPILGNISFEYTHVQAPVVGSGEYEDKERLGDFYRVVLRSSTEFYEVCYTTRPNVQLLMWQLALLCERYLVMSPSSSSLAASPVLSLGTGPK